MWNRPGNKHGHSYLIVDNVRKPTHTVTTRAFRLDEVPGYAEACIRERDNRNAAFLDIPKLIAPGIVIRNMTPRDFLILDDLGLIVGIQMNPDRTTIAKFCWHLLDRKQSKIAFIYRCARMNFGAATEAIKGYLEATFQDTPGYTDSNARAPIASWMAHEIEFCASEFGWGHQVTMNTPLRILNQIINVKKAKLDPKYRVNGLRGKVMGDRLRKENEK